ncbi:MAG: ImmA/IrrE family metallo-endopeptidase [Marinilabiliaceae bacterium]|nr:ImmA/IrrE family metallo-endopeptidase [Marinilabiliaceae bacterium]
MKINYTHNKPIKELAEFLSLEYESIITPLHQIAESEGLSIFYDDYGNAFDAMTIYDENFFIHMNTKLHNKKDSTRGRFTLAHELGHYFIDSHRVGLMSGLLDPHPSIINNTHQFKIEREADYFASCLLMPEERFRIHCNRRTFSFDLIEEIASKFNVSKTAAALRFADIGNHEIMVIYAENNKVKWKWNSSDFPYWKIDSIDDKPPEDSLMGKYFKNPLDVQKTDQLWAIDWFKDVQYDSETNKVYEHIISYKNMVLSVVWPD